MTKETFKEYLNENFAELVEDAEVMTGEKYDGLEPLLSRDYIIELAKERYKKLKTMTKQKKTRANHKVDRNTTIYNKYQKGDTSLRKLGVEYNVTDTRIKQVIEAVELSKVAELTKKENKND